MTTRAIDVAIVGAGPSGMILARLLQKSDIGCRVYDADASFEARKQHGGSLDLKQDSGQIAMEAAGLLQNFFDMAKPGGQNLAILDKEGKVCFSDVHHGEEDSYHPEIDRGDLMQILYNSLEKDTVAWGHKVERIEQMKDRGSFALHFASGLPQCSTRLIIGADGAWSKVRSHMSDIKPSYGGVTMLDLTLRNPQQDHPKLANLVGTGTMFALSPNKGIMGQRGAKTIKVYVTLRVPLSFKDEIVPRKGEEAGYVREVMDKYFYGWTHDLLDLVYACDPSSLAVRPLYQLPVNFSWEHQNNMTLIGDAAHVMSPFAGAGVNLALMDAMDVAEYITKGKNLEEYETKMRERAAESAQESANNLELFFNEDSPRDVVALFESFGPPPG